MELFDWIKSNEDQFKLLATISAGTFVASIVAVPVAVALLPSNFFVRRAAGFPKTPLRMVGRILKNVIGYALIAAGILMLVLPGQGILAMLVGLSLIDFPGKRRLQRRLLTNRRLQSTLLWIRRKAGRAPLDFPRAARK